MSRSTSTLAIFLPFVVAGGERGDVPVEEVVGEMVADREPQSSAFTPVPHSTGSRSHTGGSPSSTCTWSSENGTNDTSQSRPSAGPATTDSCAVAGERAAVVEAHCELAGHGSSLGGRGDDCAFVAGNRAQHSRSFPASAPMDGARAPSASPKPAPASTSEAWCSRT